MVSLDEAQKQPHFILVPFMAQGHMLPMVDMARLLAQKGVIVTLVTTPLNAARVQSTIDRATKSGLQIRLLVLRFPCQEAGLPEGCENVDGVTSIEMIKKFMDAIDMLQEPVEEHLQAEDPHPSCIISDIFVTWTIETAKKLEVPRLLFHGTSGFSLLCMHNLQQSKVHEQVESDSDPVVVPGLPHHIEVTKAQLPAPLVGSNLIPELCDRFRQSGSNAYGVVINSFDALEPEYVDGYRRATGKKVWAVGPVSLCNKETSDKMDRGKNASINEELCLNWLDSRQPNSVIYVCFGSVCRLSAPQLMEIGLGLEASNHSFIWVIRKSYKTTDEIEKWLKEGFEERVKDKGLIIRGWAPQMVILNHPSTGGFLTHCGWNSTLEAISVGVPMITWPLAAEQFFNEKMVVEILGIGVSIGNKVPTRWDDQQESIILVKRGEVKKTIERFMDEGKEGDKRRRKASEFSALAKMAMEESSASSYINMKTLIQDIMEQTSNYFAN